MISCGPANGQFGTVDFYADLQYFNKERFQPRQLNLLPLLNTMKRRKEFTKVIDESPDCAMAYWGIAMSDFRALWNPPTEEELQKAAGLLPSPIAARKKIGRETDYIRNAMSLFFIKTGIKDHHRCVYFEKAMEQLHAKYPLQQGGYACCVPADADILPVRGAVIPKSKS